MLRYFPPMFIFVVAGQNLSIFVCIWEKLSITWLISHKKVNLHNFKLIFLVILQVFDLECDDETSLKVVFVTLGLEFMKFEKLKSLHRDNNKIDLQKFSLQEFSQAIPYNLYYGAKTVFKILFCISSDGNSGKFYYAQI